ncbi:MAG: tRNA guanosine(34) transglycosylase Tgt, partial [Clostridia bacterium]|nr:tRNA guanosine(34) transglycosylase Tgt [Clostridia bacterium]
HLVNAGEITCAILLSMHKTHFLLNLVKNIRQAILGDYLPDFAAEFYAGYGTDKNF